MISRKLWEAVKLDPRRDYQIAHEAGLHPSMLSKILNGIEKVEEGDPRVIKLGTIVGISEDELFELVESG